MFVAQHIEDPVLRGRVVEGVAYRQCSSSREPTEEENFLLKDLGVSKQVVYQAKVSGA